MPRTPKTAPKAGADDAERLRAELLAMIGKIPSHQLVWMIEAARQHFAEKIEALELKILRAERFRKGQKVQPWDEKTIIENADDWIGMYSPLIKFLDALKKYVAHVDSVKAAEAVAAFIKSRR